MWLDFDPGQGLHGSYLNCLYSIQHSRNIDFEEGSTGKLVSVLYEHTRLIAHFNERAPDAVNAFQIGRYTLHYSNPYLKHT